MGLGKKDKRSPKHWAGCPFSCLNSGFHYNCYHMLSFRFIQYTYIICWKVHDFRTVTHTCICPQTLQAQIPFEKVREPLFIICNIYWLLNSRLFFYYSFFHYFLGIKRQWIRIERQHWPKQRLKSTQLPLWLGPIGNTGSTMFEDNAIAVGSKGNTDQQHLKATQLPLLTGCV